MGLFFAKYEKNTCCLCGSRERLTGEHKIKASALRAEFGADRLMIGTFGESAGSMRSAQSAKSKVLHFSARMCDACNSARTQAADREFDRFHTLALEIMRRGEDPASIFMLPRYAIGSDPYLNIFRYFAKLLCCHLAEISGPRRRVMSKFAIGDIDTNCIWLEIKKDWKFNQLIHQFGPLNYSAHGGLIVYGSKKYLRPTALHSSRTHGMLQYVFHSRLHLLEQQELRFFHQEFFGRCREQIQKSVNHPEPDEQWLTVGIQPQSSVNSDDPSPT